MSSDDGQAASDPALETTVSADDAGVTPGGAAGDGGRLTAGAKLGRYEIVEFIGGGGMGWVYRAKDTELEREVAIKVVQPTVAGPKGRDRLLAEARAMAKLRHRAVVPVHDVGEYAGGVYVAMALVKGGTLHDWMHAEPRPWRQVVARFLEAGRGLVAAHAAGIVHRDFKPRNVLLGEGGEVLVADFGIASASVEAADGDSATGRAREATSIVGTPAYMAPEQAAGLAVDARADQYSFCVSLWEGLHGQRPQEAETRTQGVLLTGATAAPTARRRVPGWLTDAVARGFAPAPEKRWPTLAALLDQLERGLRRRRRWGIAAASTCGVLLAVVVVLATPKRSAQATHACEPPTARMAVVWDAEHGARLSALFAATDPAHGATHATRALGALDGFAKRWLSAQVEACRATYVEHRQPEAILERRQACLDQRLAGVAERVRLIEGASSAAEIRKVMRLVDSLPIIEECTDLAQLAGEPPPPGEPSARAEYVALRAEAAAIDALRLAGKLSEHRQRAEAALVRARKLGHPIVIATLIDQVANALHNSGEFEAEVPLREEAISVGAAAHDDRFVADQWASLIFVVGRSLKQYDKADGMVLAADAAISRAGEPVHYRFDLLSSRSAIAEARGDAPGALKILDEGLALLERNGARTPGSQFEFRLMSGLDRRAEILKGQGRLREAIDAYEQAIKIGVVRFGEDHVFLYPYYGNLSVVLLEVGERDAAGIYRTLRRAAAIAEAGLEPSPRLAEVLWEVGETLLNDQRVEEAIPYLERAEALAAKTMEPGDERLADIAGSFGAARLAAGEPEEALKLIQRSLAGYEKGGPSVNWGLTLHALGDVPLCANVAETPTTRKISVEGDRGIRDDEWDGEDDRGLSEGAPAPVHDRREAAGAARGGRLRRPEGCRGGVAAA
jgi:tetratricopeptide (TPR) repeat protein